MEIFLSLPRELLFLIFDNIPGESLVRNWSLACRSFRTMLLGYFGVRKTRRYRRVAKAKFLENLCRLPVWGSLQLEIHQPISPDYCRLIRNQIPPDAHDRVAIEFMKLDLNCLKYLLLLFESTNDVSLRHCQPNHLGVLYKVESLFLSDPANISTLDSCAAITTLQLCKFDRIVNHLSRLRELPKLTNLTLGLCNRFSKVSDLNFLETLETVTLHGCKSLQSISDLHHSFLEKLTIIKCAALTTIDLGCLSGLKTLTICDCAVLVSLTRLPVQLFRLKISKCPMLSNLIGRSSCFQKLVVDDCGILETITIGRVFKYFGLADCASLCTATLIGCNRVDRLVIVKCPRLRFESFPQHVRYLEVLKVAEDTFPHDVVFEHLHVLEIYLDDWMWMFRGTQKYRFPQLETFHVHVLEEDFDRLTGSAEHHHLFDIGYVQILHATSRIARWKDPTVGWQIENIMTERNVW